MWVASIGINDYMDGNIKDLRFAEDDARAVHAYYQEAFGLPQDHLFLLTGQEATVKAIRALIGDQIAKKADAADTVIVYFAGHGVKESFAASREGDGFAKYLLPYDGKLDSLFSSALDMNDVTERFFPRFQAERVVFILDSCFSGEDGRAVLRSATRSGEIADDFFERMAVAGKGQILLTASEANAVAREDPKLGHGLFTYHLLEGLRGPADADHDSVIDVREIYDYVSAKVKAATREEQKPQLNAPHMEGRVIIGRLP